MSRRAHSARTLHDNADSPRVGSWTILSCCSISSIRQVGCRPSRGAAGPGRPALATGSSDGVLDRIRANKMSQPATRPIRRFAPGLVPPPRDNRRPTSRDTPPSRPNHLQRRGRLPRIAGSLRDSARPHASPRPGIQHEPPPRHALARTAELLALRRTRRGRCDASALAGLEVHRPSKPPRSMVRRRFNRRAAHVRRHGDSDSVSRLARGRVLSQSRNAAPLRRAGQPIPAIGAILH